MKTVIQSGKTIFEKKHIPSSVDPDTLFSFTSDLKWLLESLEYKMLFPRYNEEDISFLRSRKYKKIIVPMKCFCDINISKLGLHMEWYGDYGIAFEKKWGIEHGLQPIQYINSNSQLCDDMSTVFKEAINSAEKDDLKKEKKLYSDLKSELLLELLFKKPYTGKMVKRSTSKEAKKCLADEHEWRFIPDASSLGLPRVIIDQELKKDAVERYSNAMKGEKEVSLSFDYHEIKHIIIKNLSDYKRLVETIKKWGINEDDQYTILSRVIVWDELKGDF